MGDDPDAARRANAEGLGALRTGDSAAAIRAFSAATAADPNAGPLWRNLAHAHRMSGDDAGERAALERAVKIDQTDFAAQLRMAQLLQRRGEELAAMRTWIAVRQLSAGLPSLPPAVLAELEAGDAFVSAMQARLDSASEAALAGLTFRLGETEARRVRAFADVAAGKRQVYHNRCAGLLYPFLPADEFFDRRHFPWFADLERATPAIREELSVLLRAGEEALRPYIRLDEGSPANLWTALDGSLDWGACFFWEYGEPNRAILERCPNTAALLETLPLQQIPGRAPNVFFSLLRPGKRIPPHTGVTNTRAIVHLALDVPAGCGFRVGGETREWVEGQAFAFDDTIEHEAWNHSDRRRAVLILDTWNPHLSEVEREAVVAHFGASDAVMAGQPGTPNRL